MPTGACGINCDVCRLHVTGMCSTCGPARSDTGREKLAVQKNMFGMSCQVLSCCAERQMDYCIRDCSDFPCETFSDSRYPFSEGFLSMQERRRKEPAKAIETQWNDYALELWGKLSIIPLEEVCANSGAAIAEDSCIRLKVLDESWQIKISEKSIIKISGKFGGEWDIQVPFFILHYMVTSRSSLISDVMVAPREIVEGNDFFQGVYSLNTKELEDTYGKNGDSLVRVAGILGGVKTENADYSVSLNVFPKLIVEYMLWTADEEFPARINILLPKNTAEHFSPDSTATVINLLSGRLIFENNNSVFF